MARTQAQRRKTSRSRARRSSSSVEDLMFFPKLRRKAKWVFLLLAIAFGVGFVAFGVGTGVGGTSIGDVLRDIFSSSSGGQDLDSLKEDAAKNPKDPSAQIGYANALQAAGQTATAVAVLQKYTTANPKDADALRQLAALWGAQATKARNEAQAAAVVAAQATAGQTQAPTDSPFLQQVQGNKIAEVISTEANNRATAANTRAQNAYREAAKVYQDLTLLTPDDAERLSPARGRIAERERPRSGDRRLQAVPRARPRRRERPARETAAQDPRGAAESRFVVAAKRLSSTCSDPRGYMNFDIKTEELANDAYVIALTGEVDLYTAPEFKQQLLEVIGQGAKEVVVDFSDTTFIDSTTLGVLVGGVKRLRPNGGRLSLVCNDRNITKIFEITGLNKVFPIYESRAEAVESVGQEAQAQT